MYSIFSPQNIKINSSSIVGRQALQKSNANVAKNIVQLSTGIRVNSGRDDPTGFVSSSILSKEITSMSQAVINCQSANNLCATADSALAQISTMLNDIRALVSEAANTGASNDEMIASLQLQVDANLDSIDRIANSTQFIDKKLLDGSLDFTTYGLDKNTVDFLRVNQANFQGKIEKDIAVKVQTQAKQAELFYSLPGVLESTTLTIGGTGGYEILPFEQGASLQNIVDAVNLVSDSTGVGAKIKTQSTNGTITLSSVGLDNDLVVTASKPGSKEGNFVIKYTAPREGNDQLKINYTAGDGNDPGLIEIVLETEATLGTGPVTIKTTAEQVVNLLNTDPQLKDVNGDGILSASLPDCTTGKGTVTAFDAYAYSGDVLSQNALQFLANGTPPNIQFTSNPGQSLGLDFTSKPAQYDYAKTSIQGLDPNTSFTLQTIDKTGDYDGVSVIFNDTSNEGIAFDAARNAVVFNIDFSGRAAASPPDPIDMNELQDLVANDPTFGNIFRLVPDANYSSTNPPTLSSDQYIGINDAMGTISGGLLDPGTLIINLETDDNGLVKTTANDLIHYFDHPGTKEETDFLTKTGISVSNACNSNGCGFLVPTYDPLDCPKDITGLSPNISFTSCGMEKQDELFATSTITANNGPNAAFTITANKHDDALTGVEVLAVYNDKGPSVSYDTVSKQLTIGVNPSQPITAKELTEMINSDPELSRLFTASIPKSVPGSSDIPNGSGIVSIGDHGKLSIPPVQGFGAPMLCNEDEASVGLVFYSLEYGSSEFVSVLPSGETSFPVTDRYGTVTERTNGTDIVATINNQLAVGVGRTASISTTDLDMSIMIKGDVRDGTVTGFRITGGGALMQLGANADPAQQVRMAFHNVHTTAIGGQTGTLSELRLGGRFDMATNTRGAYSVIQESITQIATFRGQIGSFQKYELTRNIEQMTDSIEIASSANSAIKDTDYATTVSELTRNQLLIQSTTSVISYPSDNMRQLIQLLGR